MSNNLDQIVNCLRQLLQTEVKQRGAALGDDSERPSYLYLSSGDALYAETLGEVPEAEGGPVVVTDEDRLTDLGWNPPLPGDAHWYRSWQVESEAERMSAALQIQRTLHDAYGVGVDQSLNVRFVPN